MMNSRENYYNVDYKTTAKLIEWSNEGKSITIHKPQIFERTLLPIFYKHVNRFSFIRQLNSHGFTKITFYPPQAQTKKQTSSVLGNSLLGNSPPPIKLDYFSPEGHEVRENKHTCQPVYRPVSRIFFGVKNLCSIEKNGLKSTFLIKFSNM